MGIPHLEDLPLEKLLRVLNEPWVASEKLDGSFIAFGMDEEGRFYTRRKVGPRCYDMDEWPDMPWCNSFRCAHQAAEAFTETLYEAGLGLRAPFEYEAEIIWGQQPNTVRYMTPSGDTTGNSFLVLTFVPRGAMDASIVDSFFSNGSATTVTPIWYTADGIKLEKYPHKDRWFCITSDMFDMDMHLSRAAVDVEKWLERRHRNWDGAKNKDILGVNLNRRPQFVPENLWDSPAKSLLKAQLKAQRDFLREEFRWILESFKGHILAKAHSNHFNKLGRSSAIKPRETEGVVCTSLSGIVFKVTPRKDFAEANRYSHWVRYALQGGTRPPRPSFLSRTKDWPVQRRLDRLDQLLSRYVDNRHLLGVQNNSYKVHYVDPELDQRTLLLFAELRVRIRDGW